MEADFRSFLLADAPLATFVGERINWGGFPQGVASPAITLFRIAGAPGYHMQGADGLEFALVQADIRVASPIGHDLAGFADAKRTKDAYTNAVGGASGIVGSTEFRGTFVTSIRQLSEKQAHTMFHRFQVDTEIWFRNVA